MLNPFRIPAEDATEDYDTSEGTTTEEVTGIEGAKSPNVVGDVDLSKVNGIVSASDAELQFYLTDEKGILKHSKLVMNEPVAVMGVSRRLHVLVCWPETQIEHYDTRLLSSLPEVSKSGFHAKRPQESISLYKCLEAFLQEEPLGPEDMWSVFTSLIFRNTFTFYIACLTLVGGWTYSGFCKFTCNIHCYVGLRSARVSRAFRHVLSKNLDVVVINFNLFIVILTSLLKLEISSS